MSYQNMIENLEAQKLGPKAVEELQKTRFIEGIIDGKTGALAAKDAGYGVADQRTPGKLVSPEEMRARFQQIAQEKGLTLHRVADKIAQHLEAKANQTLEGREVTVSEAPDNRVQQKAIEQLTQLLGMQDASKAQAAGSSITVSVTGAAADRLLAAFEDRE
jgi:hypothetical protein